MLNGYYNVHIALYIELAAGMKLIAGVFALIFMSTVFLNYYTTVT